MFDRENFQVITKLHLERYKVLKETKQYEEALKEIEKVVTLLSEAILTVLGKPPINLPEKELKLLQGVKNLTLKDVIDPNNVITINKDGFLRIKT